MAAVCLFHRELRVPDNTMLLEACSNKEIDEVIPVFIYTPEQTTKNKLATRRFIDAMSSAVMDLDSALSKYGGGLVVMRGSTVPTLAKLHRAQPFRMIYSHRDFTKFAKDRDADIRKWCETNSVEFIQLEDYTVVPIDGVRTSGGKYFQKFTPFYETARRQPVPKPRAFTAKCGSKLLRRPKALALSIKVEVPAGEPGPARPTREYALKMLKRARTLDDYSEKRDMLDYRTTELSVYIRHGVLSVREVYHAVPIEGIRRQLYWRMFYETQIDNMGDDMYTWQKGWGKSKNRRHFRAWCEGKTGVPIVDAGMRQLAETGEMHNRVRMVCASYLIKNLHLPWRWGEQWYSSQLLDCSMPINTGNWIWVAGEKPYGMMKVRVFSPQAQALKYDPEATYIKRWVPELRDVPVETIMNDTSKAIVDFDRSREEYIKWVREARYE